MRALYVLSVVSVLSVLSLTTTAQPPDPTAIQKTNDEFVARIRKSIEGRENEPAEKVFKNIQWLKVIPAERLLNIMNMGYSRALGVTCTHCHVETDFASDEKRPKKAAREMAVMHRDINQKLQSMENLPVKKRAINCSTCHRGKVDPMAAE